MEILNEKNKNLSASGTILGTLMAQRGPQGETGSKGDTGENGYTPVKGVDYFDGEDGATFQPNVDNAGNLSWSNDKGLPNPQTVNIKGEKGDTGEQGVQGEPGETYDDTKVKNDIKRIINQVPSGAAEGENITINDSADLPYKKLNIGGNSKQETREGYNLVDIENHSTTTSTIDNINPNSISITKAGNSAYYSVMFFEDVLLEVGKTYTIERIITATNGTLTTKTGQMELYSDTASWIKVILNPNVTKNTFTVDETAAYKIRLYISTVDDGTDGFSFTMSNFMIYEGTEEKPYEPYGASPSTEFPSEIQSLGDDVNLFDINTIYPNVFISGNGQEDTSSVTNSSDYISVSANNSYVLSYDYLSLQHTNDRRYVLYDENKNVISAVNYNPANKNISFKTSQKGYVRFAYDKNCYNIKLQKGTVATAYSEYGKGTVEIKQSGKNLFDISKYPFIEKIAYANESGELVFWNGYCGIREYFPVESEKKYTFFNDLGKEIYYGLVFYDKEKNILSYMKGPVKTFITPKNCKYIRFAIQSSTLPTWVQIEKDVEETSDYEQYKCNNYVIPTTPLRSLPNGVKDTIEEDGIHRRVGSVVLDGTQDIFYSVIQGDYFLVQIPISDKLVSSKNMLSNYFPVKINWGDNITNESLYIGGSMGALQIKILSTRLSTVDNNGFKEWLSTHNTEVLYELAEEVIEPFDEEQQAVIDEIIENGTYKNITNISSASEVVPYFNIEYYKDLETLFNNLNKAIIGGN